MSIFTLKNYVDFLKQQNMESLFKDFRSLSKHISDDEMRDIVDLGNKNLKRQIKIIESILVHEKNLSIESLKRNISTIAKYTKTENYEVKKVIKSYMLMRKYMSNPDGTPPETPNSQALFSS